MLALKDAARYLHNRASKSVISIFEGFRSVFTFSTERINRLRRFIVIVRAYKAGDDVNQIADRFGCSRSTVLRYARLAGLPKRPKSTLVTGTKEAVLRDYQIRGGDGRPLYPITTIAEMNNVSPAYVSTVAREAGISRYAPRPKSRKRSNRPTP